MTYQEFFNKLSKGERWDIGVSINRSNALPLDASLVFKSKTDLDNYAKGNPPAGYLSNAYPGQIVAVVEEDKTVVYYIDSNLIPQEVGIKLSGDNSTIDITDNKISIKGFIDAHNDTLLTKDSSGNLVWSNIKDISPVSGVVKDDPILSIENNQIKSNIDIEYNETNGTIDLLGNGTILSSVKASDLFGDGLIEDVEYDPDNDALIFSWRTSSGIKSSAVQLTNLLDPYVAGDGVQLDGSEISVKISNNTEEYLSADESGIKLVGIDEKFNNHNTRLAELEAVDVDDKISNALSNYWDADTLEKELFDLVDGFRIIDGGRLEP